MTLHTILNAVAILAGIAGLVLAVKGSHKLTRLAGRPHDAPMVPEHVAAAVLVSLCMLSSAADEALDVGRPWRLAGHLCGAVFLVALTARSQLRSKRNCNAMKVA